MKTRWVPCTPEWVEKYPTACGGAVRRPTLVPLPGGQGRAAGGTFRAIGHSHLMAVFWGGKILVPVEHESGEPA